MGWFNKKKEMPKTSSLPRSVRMKYYKNRAREYRAQAKLVRAEREYKEEMAKDKPKGAGFMGFFDALTQGSGAKQGKRKPSSAGFGANVGTNLSNFLAGPPSSKRAGSQNYRSIDLLSPPKSGKKKKGGKYKDPLNDFI